MKNAALVMIATGLVTAPVQAAEWNDVRPGAFVGARLTIGGKNGRKPTAALAIAPTQHRMSSGGMTSMRIGEGIAFNLTAGARPTLTLAGVRADQALALTSVPATDHRTKSGMSDGAKVAIGVGVAAALVVGGAYLYLSNRCTEGDQ